MTPCPRCGRDNPPNAVACGGCGTLLALREERSPSPLDLELDLDRRSRAADSLEDARGPSAVEPEVGAAQAPEPDRSGWQLGTPDPAVEEVDVATGEPRPAPPARRLAAWAIDGALVAAVAVALPAALLSFDGPPPAPGGAAPGIGTGLGAALILCEAFVAVVAFVYATAAHALAGATLGKRIARIRVVGEDGRPPAPAVSAARSAWAILSLALAGAGLLPALLLPSRRALHDLLAGTRVVEEP